MQRLIVIIVYKHIEMYINVYKLFYQYSKNYGQISFRIWEFVCQSVEFQDEARLLP